jgi:thiamine-phosphate pyrophosphorylase
MLIVITSPEKLANESELINQLFDHGLEILHLRKPSCTKPDFETLLKSINLEHKRKVVLHQFHELASKYNVKGLHLREVSRKQLSISELKELSKELKRKNLTFSSSFHSKEDIIVSGNVFDYVFLSPVFDSISKPDYVGLKFKVQSLKCETKIIALGGIDTSNIYDTKELGFEGAAVLGAVWGESEKALETFINIKKAFINLSNHKFIK